MWGENGKKEEPCVRVSEKIEMEGNEVWHRQMSKSEPAAKVSRRGLFCCVCVRVTE